MKRLGTYCTCTVLNSSDEYNDLSFFDFYNLLDTLCNLIHFGDVFLITQNKQGKSVYRQFIKSVYHAIFCNLIRWDWTTRWLAIIIVLNGIIGPDMKWVDCTHL